MYIFLSLIVYFIIKKFLNIFSLCRTTSKSAAPKRVIPAAAGSAETAESSSATTSSAGAGAATSHMNGGATGLTNGVAGDSDEEMEVN